VNPQFQLQTAYTKEDFTEKLVTHFQIPRETVEGFFAHLAAMNFFDENSMTNGQLFENFFPGRNDVARFLMEPITYANGSTLDDPAITYGIVFSNFMSKGVYTFQGGTDVLIAKMRDVLLQNGVDIKLQARVEKISVENGKVTGIIHKGKPVRARAVLSNGNLLNTIQNMVGTEHFTPEFVAKTKAVRLNTSSCQVYMGFKPGTVLPPMGDLVFTSGHPTYEPERLLDLKVSSRTFSVYYPHETRPQDPSARAAIVSSTNCRYEHWKNLSEEDYEKEKAVMIEDTLKGLEVFFPTLRDHLEIVEAATPLTVERYTLHRAGSSFGTKFEGLDVSINLHKELPGLFHAGSVGIIMSGWLGAANYGVIQANEVSSYLAKANE
jgi:phytoene dehydrogenase-like protein